MPPMAKAVAAVRVGVFVVACLVALGPTIASAQDAAGPVTVQAPAKTVVGATVEIGWSGEVGDRDFISIDEVGAPESTYGQYIYANRGMPGKLRAPETPGSYSVRYHSGASGYPVRGSSLIEVVDANAVIEAPATVESGGTVEFTWTGPANERDYISIDPAGSDDRTYGPYVYAKTSPASIRAPEEPGDYLIRYHLGSSYRVIGSAALTIGGVTATLEAPARVQAGGDVSVIWEGPDGRGDYISIDPKGAPDRDYLKYRYTSQGNPAVIRVPDEPGEYEIRYHQGQHRTVIEAIPLEVLANTATVTGPAAASGGDAFPIEWTGPDNPGDYITIVPAEADAREYMSYHYTKNGSPGQLEAPLEPGSYELRYMTGSSRMVLASTTIEINPGAIPGLLKVIASADKTATPGSGAVEVILDASGSMLKKIDGERRIEIAKDALDNLVTGVIPAGTPFALRVFGHREADSCRTDLEIPLAPLSAETVSATIASIQAKNLAKTPIADSLNRVQQDLAGVSGPVTVVLLTDGEETCDGDPRAAIEALGKAGFDVRVNIVGFAINELELKEQFESWARIGNGQYIEAHDRAELGDAMNRSLDVPFEVLSGNQPIATGVVNGESVSLLPGTYRVRLLGSTPRDLGEVTIEPRTEITLSAD